MQMDKDILQRITILIYFRNYKSEYINIIENKRRLHILINVH